MLKPYRFFNGWAFLFSLLFVFFLAKGTISGNDQAGSLQLVKKVRHSLTGIKPFSVKFVQQVFTDQQMDIEESGEILFKDERHLKWTYLDPDYKVFLLLEDNYRFYDEDNEQLTRGKVKDRDQQWIWQLFFSEDILPYAFEGEDSAGKIIHFKKEEAEESLDVEIRLNSDYLPVRVIRNDPVSGARMIFYFKDYKKQTAIPEDAFELKVPGDVEIIDD